LPLGIRTSKATAASFPRINVIVRPSVSY
jgi:hypothetical protein